METVLTLVAALLALFGAQFGMKAGAFPALQRLLGAALAFLVALRALFSAAQAFNGVEPTPLPLLASGVFWAIFLVLWFVLSKLCDHYFEVFEAVRPSLADRLLGALFGLVTGTILAAALLMTATLVAPKIWPDYRREALPFALDNLAPRAFRFVETNLARVPENDAARTKLPALAEAKNDDPQRFWQ